MHDIMYVIQVYAQIHVSHISIRIKYMHEILVYAYNACTAFNYMYEMHVCHTSICVITCFTF